jgi:hypothetical protein
MLDDHPRVAAIAGSVVVGPERRPDPLSTLMAQSPLTSTTEDLPGPRVLGLAAMATMVRRQPYLDVQGFHPQFGVGGEERLLVLDLRAAGWHVCFVPEVVVHHRRSTTAGTPSLVAGRWCATTCGPRGSATRGRPP